MAVTGLRRYIKLFENVVNPSTYLFDKLKSRGQALNFITRPHNLRFEVPSSLYLVFKEIFMSDVYDIDNLVKALPERPLVIDVGANVGFFDILLLSKIGAAEIHAYEPIVSNLRQMEKVSGENNPFRESVRINPVAVTGIPVKVLNLYASDTDDTQVVASSVGGFNVDNVKEIVVEAISLSEILQQMPRERIDLLKMDCEGSEYEIMFNTPINLISRINVMLIEVHDLDEKFNVKTFSKYLTNIGFKVSYTPINGFCYALEAYKVV